EVLRDQAGEDDVGGAAQDARAHHAERHRDHPHGDRGEEVVALRPHLAQHALGGGPEVLRALPGAQPALGVLLRGDLRSGGGLVPRRGRRGVGADGRGGLLGAGRAVLRRGHQATSSSTPCERTISWYVSELSSSSAWVPCAMIRPLSSTRIRSAVVMVAMRCATMSISASRVSGTSAARSFASVVRSRALKESSNRYSDGSAARARAMHSRCRCPPGSLVPPCASGAASWVGIAATKSRPCATVSACHSSCSSAAGCPTRRFEATVRENR